MARIRGVPLRIHWSFLIFFALIVGAMVLLDFDARTILYVTGLVVTIFVFVLLHEMAHVTTARFYGVPTRSITLHPLGGVSMLERVPDRPGQEALVGFAGPLVNIVLAVILLPVAIYFHGLGAFLSPPDLLDPGTWAYDLFWINVLLGVFNLLPAFPLDGGRVMRSMLAMKVSYARATRIAAFTGRTIAIAFVVIGLFWNFILVLIGIFVFFGAAMEERSAQLMRLFSRRNVHDIMRTDPPTVHPHDSLEEVAARRDLADPLPVVVVEHGRLHGIIDLQTLSYLQPRRDRSAHSVMRSNVPTVHPDQDLSHALRQFAGGHHDAVAVVEHEEADTWGRQETRPRFIGILTTRDMEQAFQQLRQEALAERARRKGRRRGAPPQATDARIVRGEPPKEAERWVPEGTRP